MCNRDSSVSIVTRLRTITPDFDSLQGRDFFPLFFVNASTPALRLTQSPIQLVRRTLSPGIGRPGREAYPSYPYSVEVKNA
jgi:hypothetical protein